MHKIVKKVILMLTLMLMWMASPASALPVYFSGGGTFYDNSLQASVQVSASMTVNDVLMRSPGQPITLAPGEILPGGQYFFEITDFSLSVTGQNRQLSARSGTLNFNGMNDTVWDASWSAGNDVQLTAFNWNALDILGIPVSRTLTQYAVLAPSIELFAVLFDFSNPVTKISMHQAAAPVPEPTTITLFGLGLLGAAIRTRQRMRHGRYSAADRC
jgi:hypothetical protein